MSDLKILIVEDETNLGNTFFEYLNSKNHLCFLATNVLEARKLFNLHNDLSVILMDINLPDGNGIDLAREFRAVRKNFTLLFLSALNDPQTKLEGLELGADDYITKPFDLRELNLRLNRLIEMKNLISHVADEIKLGNLTIWFKRFEVQDAKGLNIALSQKECAILELLYRYKNIVVSREEIISKIWGENSFPTNRTVDNYIVKLRKWSESDPSEIVKILSVRGIGYKLECI